VTPGPDPAAGPAGAAQAAQAAQAGAAEAGRRALAGRSAEGFRECFGGEPDGVWLAPGRVNLVGEHTDYNEGFVLPFALGQGIAVAAARRPDRVLALRTRSDPAAGADIPLDSLEAGAGVPAALRDRMPGWTAYPAGVAWSLLASGYPVPGASIVIDSTLPGGAGLSSSAALECSVGLALTGLGAAGGPALSRPGLAAIARRAENEFVGVPSGIMDQSASLLCQAGHALLLDCRSLESAQVPFAPAAAGVRVLVIDTRAKHALTGGEYGSRRAECEEAARRLGVPSLRAVTGVAALDALDDPVLRRRARHVVTDNQRVQQVAGLLRACSPGDAGPLREVGTALTRSHVSLRDDFEVSWPEADVTVDVALAAGALGARMIGGGFGGSVIALVPEADADGVQAGVRAAFADHGWTGPEFLGAVPSAAAQRMR
jgi:galactokinase